MLTLCPTLLPRFKGFCSSPSVIMLFVYMKCRFSLSYRELEEMMQIPGAVVDHSTLQRWVQRFVKLISGRVRQRKKSVNGKLADGRDVHQIERQMGLFVSCR